MPQLRRLFLGNNQLRELPAALCELEQLQYLYLGDNQLQELPNKFGALRDLQWLWLHNNQLQILPATFSELRQLQVLELYGNQLRELPATLGELHRLRWLDLHNNQLRKVPATLGGCVNLQHLILHGNSSLGIPAEILGPTKEEFVDEPHPARSASPADILDYYFRPKRPLLEAKLILVGRGAVGKTSLVNRLVHNTFGKEKKTEGIKITGWDVPLPSGNEAHLNVWDFGGQEIMHATQPLLAGAERA
jgi:internalin A